MAMTILDDELKSWEAFASTGPYGYAPHARVVFRCTTDLQERPRAYPTAFAKSDAEALVVRASPAELRTMLLGAEPLE